MEVFPKLFRVALNHEASISHYYRKVNEIPQWSISFRRTLHDFEEDTHQALIGILGDTKLWREEEKWIWSMEPLESFSVKSILRSAYVANPSSPPVCNLAWNNKTLPRIQIFMWMALKRESQLDKGEVFWGLFNEISCMPSFFLFFSFLLFIFIFTFFIL